MHFFILQNTYCGCLDLAAQLKHFFGDAAIIYMSEEAMQIVDWVADGRRSTDCILADIEACDGDTLDIFRRFSIKNPLILICSSPDEARTCSDLCIIASIMKPVRSRDLHKAILALADYMENETMKCVSEMTE